MTVTKERAMQMFDRDLEILMDDLHGMQNHYNIADWEAFVFLRKPNCPESYVVKYAAASEDFAKQIVQLHATPPAAPVVARDFERRVYDAIIELGRERAGLVADAAYERVLFAANSYLNNVTVNRLARDLSKHFATTTAPETAVGGEVRKLNEE